MTRQFEFTYGAWLVYVEYEAHKVLCVEPVDEEGNTAPITKDEHQEIYKAAERELINRRVGSE